VNGRMFLASGLATLPFAALSEAAAAVPSHVIDAHTHFYPVVPCPFGKPA